MISTNALDGEIDRTSDGSGGFRRGPTLDLFFHDYCRRRDVKTRWKHPVKEWSDEGVSVVDLNLDQIPWDGARGIVGSNRAVGQYDIVHALLVGTAGLAGRTGDVGNDNCLVG